MLKTKTNSYLIIGERGGTVIAIRNVPKEFDVNKQKVTALSDVNFTIEKATYLA